MKAYDPVTQRIDIELTRRAKSRFLLVYLHVHGMMMYPLVLSMVLSGGGGDSLVLSMTLSGGYPSPVHGPVRGYPLVFSHASVWGVP